MNNLQFEKPQIFDTEMKLRALITDIEKRQDKNGKDFWIVRTRLDKNTTRDYLAFSHDYNLSSKTLSFLMNYPHHLVNNWALLTIKKLKDDKEKIIAIEAEK